VNVFPTPPFNIGRFSVLQSSPVEMPQIEQSRRLCADLFDYKAWACIYHFGTEHETGIPRIERAS